MSAVNKFSYLPSELSEHVGGFLSQRDMAVVAGVSRGARGLLSNQAQFSEIIGALTPTEAVDVNFDKQNEYQLSNRFQKLPTLLKGRNFAVWNGNDLAIHKLDQAGFFTKIGYYFGCCQTDLARSLIELCAKRVAQADEFLATPAPASLIDLRNTCIRVQNFAKEIKGMRAALAKSQESLDKNTNDLWFLARYICQFVQWLMGVGVDTSEALEKIDACHVEFNGKHLGNPGKLVRISRGGFQNVPQAKWGVRIGETSLVTHGQQRNVGIYAFPHHAQDLDRPCNFYYSGKVFFVLSEDGQNDLGSILLLRCWGKIDKNDCLDESLSCIQWHNKRNLVNRRLFVDQIDDHVFGKAGRDEQSDQPVMRKLIQLVVEISLRENSEPVEFINSYDQACVFTAAGFDSRHKQEFWEMIRKARAENKKFPAYDDERSFHNQLLLAPRGPRGRTVHDVLVDIIMQLRAPEGGTVLDTPVDFGEGETTWGRIIQASPMLPGEGPILPRFWVRDLFPFESQA